MKVFQLVIVLLLLSSSSIFSQFLVPEYIQNINEDSVTVFSTDLGGGCHTVTSKVQRDIIPIGKRSIGMIVSYIDSTFRFDGADSTDLEWEDVDNWTLIESGFWDRNNGTITLEIQTDTVAIDIIAANDSSHTRYLNDVVMDYSLKVNQIYSNIDISNGEDITTKVNIYLTTNRNLVLPSGTFYLSGDIVPKLDSTTIIGSGLNNTILKIADNHNTYLYIQPTSTLDGFVFSDLTLRGNGDGVGNNNVGFYLDKLTNVEINRVRVDTCRALTGFTIGSNCAFVDILNSDFSNNYASGCRILAGTTYGTFSNNHFENNGIFGFWYEAKDNTIIGNHASWNLAAGIYIWSSNQSENRAAKTQLIGNHCNHNGGAGIEMKNANIMFVSNNDLLANDEEGLKMLGCQNVVVNHNLIQTNDVGNSGLSNLSMVAYDGWDCTGNLITDNTFKNGINVEYAIITDANSSFNEISNNYMSTGNSGYISVSDSNTIFGNFSDDGFNLISDTTQNDLFMYGNLIVANEINTTNTISTDNTFTNVVPIGYMVEYVVFKNTTANAATLDLGTTAGTSDVFINQVIAANSFTTINVGGTIFSDAATQTLYLNDNDVGSSWNSATVNVTFVMKKIF